MITKRENNNFHGLDGLDRAASFEILSMRPFACMDHLLRPSRKATLEVECAKTD